jgi:radical SAM protein with 4Fe4S-binding SPASM domain
MCDVWRRPALEEIEPREYRKMPSSLRLVNISGGEPFLRNDLAEIVQFLREACPTAEIDISTNGLLTKQIEHQTSAILRTCPSIRVMVSIDGVGSLHDKIRGVEGAFDTAIQSLEFLKRAGVRKLGIAAVATNENLGHIHEVMKLAKQLNIDFSFSGVPNQSAITLSMKRYEFHSLDKLKTEFEQIDAALLRSFSPRNWVRAYCISGVHYYALTGKRKLPCYAGTDFFFMTPDGNIYPNMILGQGYEFGNIREASFEDIWQSRRAEEFRKAIGNGFQCKTPCWMLCTVWPHMRRNKLAVLRWIVSNKLKAHRGMPPTPVQR